MGVPASDVGYTSATTGRGDHEVRKGPVVALGKKTLNLNLKAVGKFTPRSTMLHNFVQLFGVFAKLRKATFSFVMSVSVSACPSNRVSARTEQRTSHWTYFHEIWYSSIFRKSFEEVQV
jgi:hypothetical protein